MLSGKTVTLILSAALALAVGLWAGLYLTARLNPPPLELASGVVLDPPRRVEAFELIDQDGRSFGPERLAGQWDFIYFGYTYCPDVCPTSLADLAALERRLESQGLAEATAYLLISVDPQRDTPERLGEYVRYFHPQFQGATGSRQTLDRLTRQMGVAYRIPKSQDGEDYMVDHSSAVLVVDPQARLRAIFTSHDPQAMATDFARLHDRFGGE
ncbi:MAG: SCO family protein [Candidatus Competibacteraceae bacterium]|nr:SCO family protein [Candidatus Competibacteraceae bacterium]